MALALLNVATNISATNGDAEPVLLSSQANPSITVSAGSLLLNTFTVGDDNNARIPTTTDTKSQTYSGIGSILRDLGDNQLLYCSFTPNAGAGATVINSNLNVANGYWRTISAEIAGADTSSPIGSPVAVQAGSTTSGTMTLSPITPTKNGNWIVAWWLEIQNVGDFSAPSGWSVGANVAVSAGQKAAQLLMLYHVCADLTPISPAVVSSGIGDFYHAMAYEVRQPLPPPQPPTPVMWLTTTPGPTPGQTFETATYYAQPVNRPPVTGTTRDFTSLTTLTSQLALAVPGDLLRYAGTGVLTITGSSREMFTKRDYTDYVNIDLGLKSSGNYVSFTGGAGFRLPALLLCGNAYLRFYGGEITNNSLANGGPGLQISAAYNVGDQATHHITWYNLVVHDTMDAGIRMFPNMPFQTTPGTALDLQIADCDIHAEVYNIGLSITYDTHAEPGSGQHCCLLMDVDAQGGLFPSFNRNRVAIDGHDTGLTSTQGGGCVCEIGFPDAASLTSANILILRGNNMMYQAGAFSNHGGTTTQSGGNCLNIWGAATMNVDVLFLQHHNSMGSCVQTPGGNYLNTVIEYGRYQNTNQNFAVEGSNPFPTGRATYVDIGPG